MNICPTHTCFDDAIEYIEQCIKEGRPPIEELSKHLIVHGICVAPIGEVFVHAWVEHGDEVIQGGLLNSKRIYYSMPRSFVFGTCLRLLECTRYTIAEVVKENARTGHYGPWEEKYRALLRDGDHRSWFIATAPGAVAMRPVVPPERGPSAVRLADCLPRTKGRSRE